MTCGLLTTVLCLNVCWKAQHYPLWQSGLDWSDYDSSRTALWQERHHYPLSSAHDNFLFINFIVVQWRNILENIRIRGCVRHPNGKTVENGLKILMTRFIIPFYDYCDIHKRGCTATDVKKYKMDILSWITCDSENEANSSWFTKVFFFSFYKICGFKSILEMI